MSVFLSNLQKRVFFDSAVLVRDAKYLMQLLRLDKFDVSVVCTGGKLIKSLNLRYRKRNVQTDILAFPYFEVLIAHGLCHLLGYTHDTKDSLIQMHKKESEILTAFNELTGYSTAPLTPSADLIDKPDGERFLEYQYKPPVPAGSSNARYDKVLQRYLAESQRKNSPDME
ncbi:endoribonuclease YbeY-like isoform X2 [Actinia tenebrosa]|uniref:Endoribonuclease YbeY-like isoform X2 n=1 Tax=Actinia tenebrosa TaxID=6105 RepID=A0A6P8IE45_ACTTE|nr:endoribonuclease YbeY-like isoform X2 [Actinia tenebrosa]